MKRKVFKIFIVILIAAAGAFFGYFNNTGIVSPKTVSFYNQLKDTLRKKGLSARLLVISTKRFK